MLTRLKVTITEIRPVLDIIDRVGRMTYETVTNFSMKKASFQKHTTTDFIQDSFFQVLPHQYKLLQVEVFVQHIK